MYTIDTALDTLKKFDIKESDIQAWEKALNLEIPVDEYGRKQYSPHHINLFKNIKKHLALGRNLDQIRQIVSLPPLQSSQPGPKSSPAQSPAKKSGYASAPKRPTVQGGSGAASVVELVNRLNAEKDHLYKKLLATEKLNSHLYSANSMYHRKLNDLNGQIRQMSKRIQENENFKLLDDKSRLHKQLLDTDKLVQVKEQEILTYREKVKTLEQSLESTQEHMRKLTEGFDASFFVGDWMENGQLIEIVYDNFGINIENERVRLFRISEIPSRVYGNTAVITTHYQYETNNLWKRNETLLATWVDDNTLEGELTAEYILDDVPVAKAIYRVSCTRNIPR